MQNVFVFAFGGGKHGFLANFMGNNQDKEKHL